MGPIALPAGGKVYFDANIWIYIIEGIPPYCETLRPLLQAADRGALTIVTSELSLMEVLIKPLKTRDAKLALKFEQALTPSESLLVLPVSRPILVAAARLRAKFPLRTPDAIHLSSASEAGCDQILTNDGRWRGFPVIPTLILADSLDS